MKKRFNFKAVLILALALLLVVALVACNPKNDDKKDKNPDKDPNAITAKAYFDALWDLTKGIGGDEISETDDLGVEAEFDVELGTKGTGGVSRNKVLRSVKLGVSASLVIDRTPQDNYANTAAKIIISSGKTTVAGIYFFANDPYKLYIDFAGQHLALPITLGAEYDPNNLAVDDEKGGIVGALNQDVGKYLATWLMEDGINEKLSTITSQMGEDWDLDKLVGSVLKLIPNFDLKEMVNGFLDPQRKDYPEGEEGDKAFNDAKTLAGSINGLLGTLGISMNTLFDKNDNLQLHNVLGIELLGSFLPSTKVGNVYTCDLSTLLGLVNGVAKIDLLGGATGTVSFEDADGAFKNGVEIELNLNKITTKSGGTAACAYAKIGIRHLNFKNANGKTPVTIDKNQYKSEFVVDARVNLGLNGLLLDTTPFAEEGAGIQVQLLGDFELGLTGMIDLSGKSASPVKARAWLSYKAPAKAEAENVLEATFIGEELAIKLTDPSVPYTDAEGQPATVQPIHALISALANMNIDAIGGDAQPGAPQQTGSIFDVLKELVNDDNLTAFLDAFVDANGIKADFNGAVIKGFKVNKGWLDAGNKIVDKATAWLESKTSAAGSAEEEPGESEETTADKGGLTMKQIGGLLGSVLGLFDSNADGKLDLTVGNVLELVSAIGNQLKDEDADNWTVEGCIAQVSNLVKGLVNLDSEKIKCIITGFSVVALSCAEKVPTVDEAGEAIYQTVYDVAYDKDATDEEVIKKQEAAMYAAKVLLDNSNGTIKKFLDPIFAGGFSAYFVSQLGDKYAAYINPENDITKAFTELPNIAAKDFIKQAVADAFKAATGHDYDEAACGKGGKDHETCQATYDEIVAEFNSHATNYKVGTMLIIGSSLVAESFAEMVNPLIDQYLSTEYLTGIFAKLNQALAIEDGPVFDPAKDDPIDFFFTTLLANISVKLKLDFTQGLGLSVEIGIDALDLNLGVSLSASTDADAVNALKNLKSLYDGEETGWFVYDADSASGDPQNQPQPQPAG